MTPPSLPMRYPDEQRRLLEGEAWIARRLSRYGVLGSIFAGVTDSNIRKARLRDEIKRHGLEAVICDIPNPEKPGKRKTITYAAAFERLYGEPL